MGKKNTVTECCASLDVYMLEGPADSVLVYIADAVETADAAGFFDLHFDLKLDEYYGHGYTLTGTRYMTKKELEKAEIRRARDRKNAVKSKAKTAEANRVKDLKAIKKLAKKYPDEVREQMLAIGE